MSRAIVTRLQSWLVTGDRKTRFVSTGLLCLLVGMAGGALFAFLGPMMGSAAVVGLAGGLAMLQSTQLAFACMLGLICLLPFAALPVPDIGFSPTLLDLAIGALLLNWLFQVATRKKPSIRVSSLGPLIVVFMALACASFVVGLSFGDLSTNLIRKFAELLLNILLFFLVLNTVERVRDLESVVSVLILAGAAAATIGILLYFLPQETTTRILSMLRIFRYPSGSGVLRFVEDNPDLPMRATSTSIDPNVLGGMLAAVTSLTVPQLVARHPLPVFRVGGRRAGLNWVVVPVLVLLVVCLVLTYSRTALAALGGALTIIALLRYRKIILLVLLVGLVVLALPQTQWYVQHFLEGLQGQDLATQMRFGEYKDAFVLVSRYPWLGVGFAAAPDIDTYLGVSSMYLLIAEEMGLTGLALFLLISVLGLRVILGWLGQAPRPHVEAIGLGLLAALLSTLIGGLADHYYFNINFQHAVALFWIILGLAIRVTSLDQAAPDLGVASAVPIR